MKTYRCTYYVMTKYEALVPAESEDAALDRIADGEYFASERTIYEDFDETQRWYAEEVEVTKP